ncbi:6TM ABC transporter family protein [Paracoccus aminovorans]|uniref:hypothetical protein n=1 Tax=Paracoccus aminovorans TaxID=34004 RepID=UPI002B25E25D|nr:hypothetical protein [Paracoccus aminovorans]
MTLIALATELLARSPAAQAVQKSMSLHADTANAIRSSEVIAAMGMLPELSRHWRRSQAVSLDSIEVGGTTAKFLAAIAHGSRLGVQIAVICSGATLVIRQEVSPGTIMAAAVIISRMLSPLSICSTAGGNGSMPRPWRSACTTCCMRVRAPA